MIKHATPRQIRLIRSMSESGYSYPEISEASGVGRVVVRKICLRKAPYTGDSYAPSPYHRPRKKPFRADANWNGGDRSKLPAGYACPVCGADGAGKIRGNFAINFGHRCAAHGEPCRGESTISGCQQCEEILQRSVAAAE